MTLPFKKTLLAWLLIVCTPFPFVFAQRDHRVRDSNEGSVKQPLDLIQGGRGGNFPVRPNPNENHDDSDRRRQQLSLSTVVHYPNPCLDLPANRVPEFNSSTNPANDGWTLALPAADDAYSGRLPLPFTFTLYGRGYSALFINNDGFLDFSDTQSLVVFYANVDTRGSDGGYVWRKNIGDNKFAVAWDNVGYSSFGSDKLNTFQILLSDGTDASMGTGNNVCYCYQDMQYSNNDLGIAGLLDALGGSFVLFGIFQQLGVAYDGGYGNVDGFDYLDNKSICFKASGSNIAPVAVNVPENNRVDLHCGESITNLTIFFLAPEESQAVNLTITGASAGLNVDISQQTNQSTATTVTINWAPTAAATVNVTLTASDGIDATTVNLTFTASGSSCCQGTTAEIWNPNTNKFVRALVNGSRYCLKKYNLRAVPCPMGPVVLELWKRRGTRKILLKRKKDFVPPYFLWGDKINTTTGSVDVKPNPKALPNGNYALRIKAITNATNTTNASSSFYTEIRFKQSCP